MNACDSQVGRPLGSGPQRLKKVDPLGGFRGAEVDNVDHLFTFHGFQYGLIGDQVGELQKGAELKEQSPRKNLIGDGGHLGGVEGAVEARPALEDSVSEGLREVGGDPLHGVPVRRGVEGDALEGEVGVPDATRSNMIGTEEKVMDQIQPPLLGFEILEPWEAGRPTSSRRRE
ncbi:hypothetical protein SAY86_001366 [Trapa natans]|uniref:Uncharacterized protein n=1 Tax=Trapa natans TaxID=22666 RepID=A0AAN7RNV5_TRANT|nr:hypothetical protein SAY86_001366 [Trapa natans]